jgi:hypothetical protein
LSDIAEPRAGAARVAAAEYILKYRPLSLEAGGIYVGDAAPSTRSPETPMFNALTLMRMSWSS